VSGYPDSRQVRLTFWHFSKKQGQSAQLSTEDGAPVASIVHLGATHHDVHLDQLDPRVSLVASRPSGTTPDSLSELALSSDRPPLSAGTEPLLGEAQEPLPPPPVTLGHATPLGVLAGFLDLLHGDPHAFSQVVCVEVGHRSGLLD
jgi:hypothetical protein